MLVELGATTLGNVPTDLAKSLLEQAGEADGPGLKRIQAGIAKLVSGAVPGKRNAENPRHTWTVQELSEARAEGDLAKDFPDQIKVRRAVDNDLSRLERHVNTR